MALVVQHLAERVEHFGAVAHGFGERRRADRHDHALLELQRALGVLAAVDHVHHRHRQRRRATGRRDTGTAARRATPPRRARPRATRPAARSRRGSPCSACRRARCIVRSISRCEVASIPSIAGPMISLTARDRFEHALAAVALGIAVAQLDRLVRAGRRARRHHRFFHRAERRRDGDGDGRVSARIEHSRARGRFRSADVRRRAAIRSTSRRLLRGDPVAEHRARAGTARRRGRRSRPRARADSAESEPCTRLRPIVWPKSPRIVPGVALIGFVAPIVARQPSIASSPSITIATIGVAGDVVDQPLEERPCLRAPRSGASPARRSRASA